MKTNSIWAETLQAILNRLVLLKVDLLDLKAKSSVWQDLDVVPNPNVGQDLDAMLVKVDESADLVRDLLYGKDVTIRRLGLASALRPAPGRPEGPPEGTPPGK